MVSNADVGMGEAWELVQNKTDEDVCVNVSVEEMPHVIHYCKLHHLFSLLATGRQCWNSAY